MPSTSLASVLAGTGSIGLFASRAFVSASRLVQEGFRLMRLEDEKVNLETAFMRLTKGLVQ